MNYHHSYHAGNFADVFKHCLLSLLLTAFKNKAKPFCYIDTHAGAANYDLTKQSTGEYQQGIAKLKAISHPAELLKPYLTALEQHGYYAHNHYPGSVTLASYLLRTDDRIIASELNETLAQQLKHYFRADKRVHIHQQDAYLALKAFLPPAEKRGIVMIDPPYEDLKEWENLPQQIHNAYQRWPSGCFMLWYPIKDYRFIRNFYQRLKALNIPNCLIAECCPWPKDVANRLNGSGALIINPPWQFDGQLAKVLPKLLKHLKQQPGAQCEHFWLTAAQ